MRGKQSTKQANLYFEIGIFFTQMFIFQCVGGLFYTVQCIEQVWKQV